MDLECRQRPIPGWLPDIVQNGIAMMPSPCGPGSPSAQGQAQELLLSAGAQPGEVGFHGHLRLGPMGFGWGAGFRGEGMDLFSLGYETGVIDDGRRVGGRINAAMAKGRTDESLPVGVGGGNFTANAELSIGEDGATAEAVANIFEVEARLGELSALSPNDHQLTVNAGKGVGQSLNLHWSDEDGDTHREYGAGYGPVDYKTEDPKGLIPLPRSLLPDAEPAKKAHEPDDMARALGI